MEKQATEALINRYITGQASPHDLMLLETWYLHLHEDEPMEVSAADRVEDIRKVKAALDARFKPAPADVPVVAPVPVVTARLYRRMAIAASLAFVISIGLYQWNHQEPARLLKPKVSVITRDILPGGNKAVLTLADGRRIDLSDSKSGILAMQGGTQVLKKADGELSYTVRDDHSYGVKYNRISTPRGGVYKVHLPDGSQVWLNAASTLTYPTAFTSLRERRVKLSGEAYFEVVRNKALPFRVITGTQSVEVLGTHFNINAYPQQGKETIRTTLLKGSVSLNGETILKPGEQALNENSVICVSPADTSQVMGWKKGFFMFNKHGDFKAAMQEIERWYNVEFVYPASALPETQLIGKIPTDTDLSVVLNAIVQSTKGINFKIEGRRVLVTN